MSIDYSVLAHAKPRPAALDRVARAKGWKRRDARESETVRRRSGGRCEVVFSSGRMAGPRCVRRAVHVHHIVGGHGGAWAGPVGAGAVESACLRPVPHGDPRAHPGHRRAPRPVALPESNVSQTRDRCVGDTTVNQARTAARSA